MSRLSLLALAIAAAFTCALVALPHDPGDLQSLAAQAGAAAPLMLLTAWIVLTPALFPGTLLAAAGGLAFGGPAGAALACAGALLGSLVAFAIARGVGRQAAEDLLSGRMARARGALERRGFTAILVARLAPGVPATALNYVAGVSRVRTGHFAAAMSIGAAIRTAPYALLGAGIAAGSTAAVAVAGASIATGALVAAVLVQRLRSRPPAHA